MSSRRLVLLLVLAMAIAALGVTLERSLLGEQTEVHRQRLPPIPSAGGPTDATNAIRPGSNGAAVAQPSAVASPGTPGPAETSDDDAEAPTPDTVLWPVAFSRLGRRGPATIDPGTLLTVLARSGERATLQLPDGAEGYVAACALTSDGAELAIARALAGTEGEKAAARRASSAAVLAPMLDGKPPREIPCAQRSEKDVARSEHAAGPPTSGVIESLGLWRQGFGRVRPPSVHDWIALARGHGGIADDVPLRPAERQKARLLIQREAVAEVDERMTLPPPSLDFEVPAEEVRGAYFALGTAAVQRVTQVSLGGEVFLSVDCRGCETGPRRYDGYAKLGLPASMDAAVVLWLPAATAFDPPRPLPPGAWTVAEGKPIEIRVPHPSRREPVAYVLPYFDRSSGTTMANEPFSVVRAYVTGFPSLGVRLLVVETKGNPACARGLFVYEVTEGALRILDGTDFDCDL